MLHMALSSFYDALSSVLRNQVEKGAALDNYDLVMLCLDEVIDDGWVCPYRSRTCRVDIALWTG